ncbi:MAG: 4-hydroxy-3-methylbut-2-enyl diphosphate reductase [Planctomycetes bacterium]|nr:4-hydroxy-3-methylbut-2-enyl diphosphate reductase [Planctomycetota bacterium]
MKIIIAKTTGFCWGVKRAMELAQQMAKPSLAKRRQKIYTLGPLIHNQEAVELLEKQGIMAYNPKAKSPAVIIIRAHGLPPDAVTKLEKRGFKIIDATCPHVKVSEKKAKQYAGQGFRVIIVGDKKHAEVISLVGYAKSGNAVIKPLVVSSPAEAKHLKLKKGNRYAVIAQSTFQKEAYEKIVAALKKRIPDLEVIDTICRVTTLRQEEIKRMAKRVDAFIVVGAHHSANTTRLALLARSTGVPTFHIAQPKEIPFEEIRKYRTIGITSGTSTPEWITESVINALKNNG